MTVRLRAARHTGFVNREQHMSASWSVEMFHRPTSAEDPRLLSWLDVMHDASAEAWGVSLRSRRPQAQLSELTDTSRQVVMLDVRSRGVTLGAAQVQMPLTGSRRPAVLDVAVLRTARSRGIGSALFSAAEDVATQSGRDTLTTRIVLGPTPTVGAQHGLRLAAGRGMAHHGTHVTSVLDLTTKAAPTHPQVPDGYILKTWEGTRPRCPKGYVDDLAALFTKFKADTQQQDELWDRRRVRDFEQFLYRSGGHTMFAAIEHNGDLVGFTLLRADGDHAWQGPTMVDPAHRGKQLAVTMKRANLAQMVQLLPEVRQVWTTNPKANTAMLRINWNMGFVRAGDAEGWQKQLTGAW